MALSSVVRGGCEFRPSEHDKGPEGPLALDYHRWSVWLWTALGMYLGQVVSYDDVRNRLVDLQVKAGTYGAGMKSGNVIEKIEEVS